MSNKTTTDRSRHLDRQCPKCGRVLIPIAYGYPSESTFEESEAGRVRLGGCVVTQADPQWWCENDRAAVYLSSDED